MIKAIECEQIYAHQIPPHLSFCTPGQNTLRFNKKMKTM